MSRSPACGAWRSSDTAATGGVAPVAGAEASLDGVRVVTEPFCDALEGGVLLDRVSVGKRPEPGAGAGKRLAARRFGRCLLDAMAVAEGAVGDGARRGLGGVAPGV